MKNKNFYGSIRWIYQCFRILGIIVCLGTFSFWTNQVKSMAKDLNDIALKFSTEDLCWVKLLYFFSQMLFLNTQQKILVIVHCGK